MTQIQLEGAGIGVEKIAELYPEGEASEVPVVEGSYMPESGIAPLKGFSDSAVAYHHHTRLRLKDVVNDALGIRDNSGVLSQADFKAQGGLLGDPVLLNFKTALSL